MSASKQFWVGQALTVVATVLGVFLAAYTGFKTAVDFERITNDRDMYYLIGSLHDELDDNVSAVDELAELFADPSYRYTARLRPNFPRFVWQTMRYSETTLQVPNTVLSSVRRFYSTVDATLDKLEKRQTTRQKVQQALAESTQRIREITLLEMVEIRNQMRPELLEHELITE